MQSKLGDSPGQARSGGKENQFTEKGLTERMERMEEELRYRQIEVDMLRKVKAEAERTALHNQRLQGHNRNLLKRVDFLTR